MMGIAVGHSSLHRLVARVAIPAAQGKHPSGGMSAFASSACSNVAFTREPKALAIAV
jgi:hypothetical protein